MPDHVPEPWYDADHAVRRVRHNGEIKWQGDTIFISEALVGEPIGIRPLEDGHWLLRFADINLGLIDRSTRKFHRFGPGRPPRTKAQPTKTVSDVTGL